MYNLIVAYDGDAWNGTPYEIDPTRCFEYTAKTFHPLRNFGSEDVKELCRHPCIFAYESHNKLAPKFGLIRDVVQRQGKVRIEYQLEPLPHFLTAEQLPKLLFELDIDSFELNRTHWAIKDVDLPKEMHKLGIALPRWASRQKWTVDITNHSFDVGLSFPGDDRTIVESILPDLERRLGPNSYFYDFNYQGQLARPSLDLLLLDIYGKRTLLNVVFISENYERKIWCSGVEFRAIRQLIQEKQNERIMYVRTGDGKVDGVLNTDGYIDIKKHAPEQIAEFIEERVHLLKSR